MSTNQVSFERPFRAQKRVGRAVRDPDALISSKY